MSIVQQGIVPYRWVAPLLALVAALLVPWTLLLAYRLPSRHTSHHWDIAWVGFDIALAGALAAMGWAIARQAEWAPSVAAAAATLLLSDAWFDNVLANGLEEHVEAALEAALLEVPLALLCLWLARNSERTMTHVTAALERRKR